MERCHPCIRVTLIGANNIDIIIDDNGICAFLSGIAYEFGMNSALLPMILADRKK